MGLRSRNKVSTEFSMSSMSDMVFLLLIFFMITSTLIHPTALKLVLPKSSHQTSAPKPITTISIDKDLQYAIEGEYVPYEQLEQLLIERVGPVENPENAPTISLHAEKSVDIEHVVNVMNIAKRHKYRLILATDPK